MTVCAIIMYTVHFHVYSKFSMCHMLRYTIFEFDFIVRKIEFSGLYSLYHCERRSTASMKLITCIKTCIHQKIKYIPKSCIRKKKSYIHQKSCIHKKLTYLLSACLGISFTRANFFWGEKDEGRSDFRNFGITRKAFDKP